MESDCSHLESSYSYCALFLILHYTQCILSKSLSLSELFNYGTASPVFYCPNHLR